MTEIIDIPVLESNVKLYTPRQILVASILGSPIAGSILLALDYKALQQVSTAKKVLLWGILGTLILVIIGFLLPLGNSGSYIGVVGSVALFQYSKQAVGAIVEKHIAAGGQKQSWWLAIGIGLLSLVGYLILLGIAVAVYYILFGGSTAP